MRGVKAKQLRKASTSHREYHLFKKLYRKGLYKMITEMILNRGKSHDNV